MIHHLRGRLVEKTPTYAVIECSGVGYQVHISLNTFEQLGNDESVMLHTHMVVREDAQLLYGFSQPEERTMFLLLLGVSGVGASTARMILSAMNVDRPGHPSRGCQCHEKCQRHRRENRPAHHHRFAGQIGRHRCFGYARFRWSARRAQ